MKKLILPIFCMTIIIGCTTQEKPPAKTELSYGTPYNFVPDFLKGKVKSVEQKAYWATEQDGKYVQGDLITRKERDSIGWSYDFIVTFDSLGLTEKVDYLDDDGNVTGHWIFKSDDGHLTGGQWFEGDSSSSYWRFTYDDDGNLSKSEHFRLGADTLLGWGDRVTGKGLNWTSITWSNAKGEPVNSRTREFNDMGLVTSLKTTDPEGKTIAWFDYTYDGEGNAITMKGMTPDSTMINAEMKYTEVDDTGNWLKMVSFEDGKLVGMDVRTITYY
jgi:hypothetical protein